VHPLDTKILTKNFIMLYNINIIYYNKLDKERYFMKKTWYKPNLIILSKGSPEETVLTACKFTLTDGAISHTDSKCEDIGVCPVNCETRAAS